MLSGSPGLPASGGVVAGSDLFVGRVQELALISSWAEKARRAQSGVVWIEGEPGSGKSLLARRALVELSGGARIARASADQYADSASLAVAEQLTPLETHSPLSAGLELLDHLTTLSEESLVVVLVEDLHWADPDSRRALLVMAQRMEHDHVLLLLTSRPDIQDTEWQRFRLDADRCAHISMSGFTVREVAELAALMGSSLTPANANRLHQHTDGHPLYVRTLLNELSREQLERDEALPVPRSLVSTTMATLARLPQPARDLACALAVLNRSVPLSVAGQVADIEDASLALEQLLPTGLATWKPREPRTPIELAHPLFRTAVYDDLSPTTRRKLHLAAADLSDGVTALVHRVSAADTFDDRLADELAAAAEDDGSRFAISTKAQYLLWASSLTSDRARRETRLLEATRLLLIDRRVARALTQRPQVEQCASSPHRSLVLGMMDWVEGDPASAELHFQAASSTEAAEEDPATAADALIRVATIRVTRLEAPEAIAAAQQAVRLALDDDAVLRDAIGPLVAATCVTEGGARGLEVMAEHFSTPAARAGSADAEILVTRGMAGYYAGQLLGPIEDLRRAVALARHGARVAQLPRAHVHLCQLLFKAGDWDDAQVHARLALSLIADDPHVWEEAQVYAAASLVPSARGQWDVSTRHLDKARRAAAASGTPESVATCRLAEAFLARAQLRWPEACTAIAPVVRDARLRRFAGPLRYWTSYVEALVGAGNLEEAHRQLAAFEADAAEGFTTLGPDYFGVVASIAGAEGRPGDATAAFDRAFACASDADPVLDRALLHHAFGRHLHGTGERAGAFRSLGAALELLKPLGAWPFVERVEVDLVSWGVRLEDGASRPALKLTEREQSVAALVGRGMTNREVAAELYVSQKAVEYHLSNIYGKLGIRSRRELRNHPALALQAVGA